MTNAADDMLSWGAATVVSATLVLPRATVVSATLVSAGFDAGGVSGFPQPRRRKIDVRR